jgi:hypothetical protein
MKTNKKIFIVTLIIALFSMVLTIKSPDKGLTMASDLPTIESASTDDGLLLASDLPTIESASVDDGLLLASDLLTIVSA